MVEVLTITKAKDHQEEDGSNDEQEILDYSSEHIERFPVDTEEVGDNSFGKIDEDKDDGPNNRLIHEQTDENSVGK